MNLANVPWIDAVLVIGFLALGQNDDFADSVKSAYDRGEFPLAHEPRPKWFRDTCARAERGDVKAQFDLGVMYYAGQGGELNPAKAVA
ncbi:MAG: SEL1-like repeat protein [Alphaproteobacteria bacterium]|nr:SEL1-like repeat protein [Alphaproteobacteria bacterium]